MRTLLIRPGGIGDSILCFPAMEHLRSAYTEVWISGSVAPLVTFGDRVASIASTGIDRVGIPGLDSEPVLARLGEFDRIVSWYGTNRDEFREAVTGLPFEFHPAFPMNGPMHVADFFASQVGLGSGAVPRISIRPPVQRRSFVAVHPFSGSAKKDWPLDELELIAAEFTPMPFEWCATQEQRPLLGSRDVQCFDNLMELARWLAAAAMYVGNDSGITHLAAAVGTPVVALFTSASDPAVWAPRGEATVRLIRSQR